MFERFTERARQVVVLSQDEARLLRHAYIGTEHLLLGLLREQEGLAARLLDSLDVAAEEVRAQIARIVGQGDEVTTGQIPFTPRAKKVLEGALKEAVQLGHRYIGTEHILLGLVRLDDGVAARILLDFGADAEKIRTEVLRLLGSPDYDKQVHVVIRRSRAGDSVVNQTQAQTIGELVSSLAPSDQRAALETAIETAVQAITLGQLLDAVRSTKEAYIEEQDFERAAKFRDIERTLSAAIRGVQAQGT